MEVEGETVGRECVRSCVVSFTLRQIPLLKKLVVEADLKHNLNRNELSHFTS